MFIVTPDTVWNARALETRNLPKRILGRIAFLPRSGSMRLWARVLFEAQMLRYTAALAPFVVAMFVWPHLALPIAQAPLAMIIVIGFVELRVLAVPREKRARLIDADAAARRIDMLRFRSSAILTRIAAENGMTDGEISLVVEQSAIARVPPLTLVSVQRGGNDPAVISLTPAQQAMMATELFDSGLSERDLHRVNLRDDSFVRSTTLEARSVSAHARMAALSRPAA